MFCKSHVCTHACVPGNEDKNINEDEDDIVSPVSSKSKSSVTAVREDAARAASAVGGGGGGIGGRGGHGDGDDDDTENTVELGSLNAGEPVWQSVLAQVLWLEIYYLVRFGGGLFEYLCVSVWVVIYVLLAFGGFFI